VSPEQRRDWIDWGVYLIVRAVVALVQALPLRIALQIGRLIGWIGFTFDKRHREVARDNLRHAFPELASDPAAIDRLVRGCFRHFGTMIVEIACIPRKLHVHNWRSYATHYQLGLGIQHMIDGRPLLLVTAHYGNWEIAGYIVGLVGFKSYAIARVLDNRYIEDFLKTFRQKTGQTILAKKGDFDQITGVLATNRIIATLGDQDAGPRGLFVNFFNRPASTHKAVSLLALEYDVPMAVVGTPRIASPMKFALEVETVLYPNDYRDQPDAVRRMTQDFTSALERIIRRHPEQYFWLHRRWKHQPQPRKVKPKTA
jgi:KDO2-lipid IV(A) lauroyltransferase